MDKFAFVVFLCDNSKEIIPIEWIHSFDPKTYEKSRFYYAYYSKKESDKVPESQVDFHKYGPKNHGYLHRVSVQKLAGCKASLEELYNKRIGLMPTKLRSDSDTARKNIANVKKKHITQDKILQKSQQRNEHSLNIDLNRELRNITLSDVSEIEATPPQINKRKHKCKPRIHKSLPERNKPPKMDCAKRHSGGEKIQKKLQTDSDDDLDTDDSLSLAKTFTYDPETRKENIQNQPKRKRTLENVNKRDETATSSEESELEPKNQRTIQKANKRNETWTTSEESGVSSEDETEVESQRKRTLEKAKERDETGTSSDKSKVEREREESEVGPERQLFRKRTHEEAEKRGEIQEQIKRTRKSLFLEPDLELLNAAQSSTRIALGKTKNETYDEINAQRIFYKEEYFSALSVLLKMEKGNSAPLEEPNIDESYISKKDVDAVSLITKPGEKGDPKYVRLLAKMLWEDHEIIKRSVKGKEAKRKRKTTVVYSDGEEEEKFEKFKKRAPLTPKKVEFIEMQMKERVRREGHDERTVSKRAEKVPTHLNKLIQNARRSK